MRYRYLLFLAPIFGSITFLVGADATHQVPEGYELIPFQVNDPLQPTLINGRPASPGEYPEIVQIQTGNALCTATLIGPRVILTAAHCAGTGAISKFRYDGQDFEAVMTRSPLYPGVDHDIALGLVNKSISVRYADIGGTPGLSEDIILTGYGCTSGDGNGSDGILRVGISTVVGFDGYDFITKRLDGSALCFGDSGGPSYVDMDDPFVERHTLLGVNSKGNIIDTSLITRTDHPDSGDFLRSWSDENNVDICGINRNCAENPEPAPGCFKKFVDEMKVIFKSLADCKARPHQLQSLQ